MSKIQENKVLRQIANNEISELLDSKNNMSYTFGLSSVRQSINKVTRYNSSIQNNPARNRENNVGEDSPR